MNPSYNVAKIMFERTWDLKANSLRGQFKYVLDNLTRTELARQSKQQTLLCSKLSSTSS